MLRNCLEHVIHVPFLIGRSGMAHVMKGKGKEHILESIRLANEYPSDFTLQYPPRREYYKEIYRTKGNPKYLHEILKKDNNILCDFTSSSKYDQILMLYCHIPFCEHKCFYCNFAVDTRPNVNNLHNAYVDKMIDGLHKLQNVILSPSSSSSIQIPGIDIGGGTPTLLETHNLKRFLEALRPIRDFCTHPFPLSIETTPAIASKHMDRLHVLKEGGVDRVSMGLQSTDDELLSQMNRGKEMTLSSTAVKNIQDVGFKRFSVDIIFGLPNQQMKHWKNDIHRIVDSDIQIVTTYDCLYRGKGRAMTKKSSVPPPEKYGEFYDYGYEFLTKNGFHAPYGSVNFSKYDGETGTSAYFEGRLLNGFQFLGLGNYSSSVFEDKWWFAPYSVDQWLHDIDDFPLGQVGNSPVEQMSPYFPIGDCYTLPLEERAAKYILLSLSFGMIDPARFFFIFQKDIHEVYPESFQVALQNSWMWKDDSTGNYFIVPGQFKNMPKIRSLFYSKRAVSWLQHIRDHPQDQFRHRLKAIQEEKKGEMQESS